MTNTRQISTTCILSGGSSEVSETQYSAFLAASDGKIYLVSETSETLVLSAGWKPEVLARNSLGEQSIASTAISNGHLFIRTDRNLVAIRTTAR